MNKVVYVPAYFLALTEEKIVKVPTGEKKKGLFGGEKDVTRKEKKLVQVGYSDSKVDGKRLAEDLDKEITKLNAEGYEVVNVASVISGEYNYKYEQDHKRDYGSYGNGGYGWGYGWGYGYGYGYSYTDSLIVIAKKIV